MKLGKREGEGKGGGGWRVNDVYRIGNVYRNYQRGIIHVVMR